MNPLIIFNLTPDSFSDGGLNYQLDFLENNLKLFIENNYFSFDFGAQSTAPTATAIDYNIEKERLKSLFLPIYDRYKNTLMTVSIDTYRVETMAWLMESIHDFKGEIIWNDVSGVLDRESLCFLRKNENIKYVLSHNNIHTKGETPEHMNFVKDCSLDEFLKEVIQKWNEQKSLLSNNNISFERVYWDPCFGFAKSREQNEFLFDNLLYLEKELEISNWLIGISRKSFLRARATELGSLNPVVDCEILHYQWLIKISQLLQGKILCRLHNPFILTAMQSKA